MGKKRRLLDEYRSPGFRPRADVVGVFGDPLARVIHFCVGRKCRAMTVKDVAKELRLDWHTVKALEIEYMQKQMERNPAPAPRVIGIDEVSLLGDALDTLRKQEYARLSGEDRSYIKGQKYTLLSNRENLTMDGRNCSGLTSGLIRAIC